MSDKVCARDRFLTALSMTIGVLVWLGVAAVLHASGLKAVLGLLGAAIIVLPLSFVVYLFAKSAAIAHLRGNATEVTAQQLPELHKQLTFCCETLHVPNIPTMYVQNGNGVMNAFATWFLGQKYVILLSGVVDAMAPNPTGVRFYIGHELGHILRHDNPVMAFLRWPSLRLPLLGAAFSRARETTCDLHGLACSETPDLAARSLAALAVGARSWAKVSLDGYRQQIAAAGGFWMSFHELVASYPWTGKRIVRVLDRNAEIPRRNPFAYLFAFFVPYAGRMGAGFGVLVYVYVIGVMAAVAIPAYQAYTVRAALTVAMAESQQARQQLVDYYVSRKAVPQTLNEAGVADRLPNGVALSLDPDHMVLTVHSAKGDLIFTPRRKGGGQIIWTCSGGQGAKPQQLPLSCR